MQVVVSAVKVGRTGAVGKQDLCPNSSQISSYARLLRLTPVEGLAAAPVAISAPSRARLRLRPRRRIQGLAAFLLLVVAPACIAAVYLWGMAVDRFEIGGQVRPSNAGPQSDGGPGGLAASEHGSRTYQ